MSALTYKKAGVDIDRADAFLEKIKPLLQKTKRAEVLGKSGGFSGVLCGCGEPGENNRRKTLPQRR